MLKELPDFGQEELRLAIRLANAAEEQEALARLHPLAQLIPSQESAIWQRSYELVGCIREKQAGQGGVDALLQEFSLSSEEGVVLMCLAEALLRIPDDATQDRMIQDRLGSGDWSAHLGHSDSLFVNASAWGLLLTGKVTGLSGERNANVLEKTISRLGEPVIRSAMRYAMQIMGAQFVMGRNVAAALARAKNYEAMGYTYSYDMLGEGARTMEDADRYFEHYGQAIDSIGGHKIAADRKPGISLKLSALHPRFEPSQHARVKKELADRLRYLALQARQHDIGLTVDSEESWRLDLTLEVFQLVYTDPELEGWDGFGLAIQAYQKNGFEVARWLIELARKVGRKISIRLVKGAYWDTEIKHAQERGFAGYPVFTEKSATDVCYQACARLLMESREYVYPQFATHNAYTVATVLEFERASGVAGGFEFQRLHGMGEELYDDLVAEGQHCRIYAPVGEHADLLAYLVRRLLENGANTSFVNNIQNRDLPLGELLHDPVSRSAAARFPIPLPGAIYHPHRQNSQGLDLDDHDQLIDLATKLNSWWDGRELNDAGLKVRNPADLDEIVGFSEFDDEQSMQAKLAIVAAGRESWSSLTSEARSEIFLQIADYLEAHRVDYIGLCVKEAGKTLDDGIAEVREAVDFCRYYAREGLHSSSRPLGTVLCISPWNFPLAIFLGQVSAALITGNTVLAKPAEQTSLIARKVVQAMYRCGVPEDAIQLVVSTGAPVSEVLVPDQEINGVMFTGSSRVARLIARRLHDRGEGPIPLVAETGGMNAMIVDSTALAEQVVDDVIASCFHSAGQRCSAARLLYVQDDIADVIIRKISGKMAELVTGDPASLTTDVGPIIDEAAWMRLDRHIARLDRSSATLLYRCNPSSGRGFYMAPAFYEIEDLALLDEEVFGPILHLRRFRSGDLESVVDEINDTGFGLTLGVHSRIEGRCNIIAERVRVGNVYVNRNMVGAVVGVQPFGGRGKSGTGPKAGGPRYLPRLRRHEPVLHTLANETVDAAVLARDSLHWQAVLNWQLKPAAERIERVRLMILAWLKTSPDLDADEVIVRFATICEWLISHGDAIELPSPTGEVNTLGWQSRGVISIIARHMDVEEILLVATSLVTGNGVKLSARSEGFQWLKTCELSSLIAFSGPVDLGTDGIAMVAGFPGYQDLVEKLLEAREELVPVIIGTSEPGRYLCEKTISVNTTAAGGNASLMALN